MNKIFLCRLFSLLTLCLGSVPLVAQVTIGSDNLPVKAALLDLKNQDDATGGVTSDKGGLLFSRVKLINQNDLRPFIPSGGDSVEKSSHKGLVVYNLTVGAGFTEGLHCWDGTKWQAIKEGYSLVANNGLTTAGETLQLGGQLTQPTTITGNTNNKLRLEGPLLQYKNGTQAEGKVLVSDADGNASWQRLGMMEPGKTIVWDNDVTTGQITELKDAAYVYGPYTVDETGWYKVNSRWFYYAKSDDKPSGVDFIVNENFSNREAGICMEQRLVLNTKVYSNPCSNAFVYLNAGTNYYIHILCVNCKRTVEQKIRLQFVQ